jgi:hypothetical protein
MKVEMVLLNWRERRFFPSEWQVENIQVPPCLRN